MSEYYSVPRKADWNYGGKRWRLSRSKIGLFQECPRCFYLDNRLGLKRPPGYPFNLNTAVDTLLKREFDAHLIPYMGSDYCAYREAVRAVET